MWCPSCSADVAAELSADERRFLCTRCQTELGLTAAMTRPAAPAPVAAERDARELLARWSAHSVLDEPVRPVSKREPPPVSVPITVAKTESPPVVPPESKPSSKRLVVRREAASVGIEAEKPPEAPPAPPSRSGLWLLTMGQLAAYAGIGLITCGTALVIWSYYGGPPSYAPTGWLISALGQMLFFLGLVNLVSGGLDHTSAELRHQMERLRAEQRTTNEIQSASKRRPPRRRRDAA